MEDYRNELISKWSDLTIHMTVGDSTKVYSTIVNAKTYGELDGIALGLGFHKWRVENREIKDG